MKPKYLIANLVYGQVYTNLFLTNHLKSILDPSNLPSLSDFEIYYVIFTDSESLPHIKRHPNFARLSNHAKVDVVTFALPPGSDAFAKRYDLQIKTFKTSCQKAKDMNAIFSYWTADSVVAKDFFKCLDLMKDHDAILNVPIRACAESLRSSFDKVDGAFPALELFQLGYDNLHPLWVASHWEAPQFSIMPYSILWNTGQGLVAHSFSITPIVMRPNQKLIACDKVPDADVSAIFENPYRALNWTDVPSIGAEPLICFYPPWKNNRASVDLIRQWSKHIEAEQVQNLKYKFHYPNAELSGDVETSKIVQAILSDDDSRANYCEITGSEVPL